MAEDQTNKSAVAGEFKKKKKRSKGIPMTTTATTTLHHHLLAEWKMSQEVRIKAESISTATLKKSINNYEKKKKRDGVVLDICVPIHKVLEHF